VLCCAQIAFASAVVMFYFVHEWYCRNICSVSCQLEPYKGYRFIAEIFLEMCAAFCAHVLHGIWNSEFVKHMPALCDTFVEASKQQRSQSDMQQVLDRI